MLHKGVLEDNHGRMSHDPAQEGLQTERKPQMSKEGKLTGGDRREGEGNKLVHRMDIHKDIKVNYYAENRKEGGGGGGVGIGRGLIDR